MGIFVSILCWHQRHCNRQIFSLQFCENLFAENLRSKNAKDRPAIAWCWRLFNEINSFFVRGKVSCTWRLIVAAPRTTASYNTYSCTERNAQMEKNRCLRKGTCVTVCVWVCFEGEVDMDNNVGSSTVRLSPPEYNYYFRFNFQIDFVESIPLIACTQSTDWKNSSFVAN